MKNKLGFTLIEMLVVVLIIGILAGIALPQYKMAVTKAKVASILPLMRRWKDALAEYKLQHGDYCDANDGCPDADTLGVNWPSDWKVEYGNTACNNDLYCSNDYWAACEVNDGGEGQVSCHHITSDGSFYIIFNPDDDTLEEYSGKIICEGEGEEGIKICKAIGKTKIQEEDGVFVEYALN